LNHVSINMPCLGPWAARNPHLSGLFVYFKLDQDKSIVEYRDAKKGRVQREFGRTHNSDITREIPKSSIADGWHKSFA
jgi:hypothetical protein